MWTRIAAAALHAVHAVVQRMHGSVRADLIQMLCCNAPAPSSIALHRMRHHLAVEICEEHSVVADSEEHVCRQHSGQSARE